MGSKINWMRISQKCNGLVARVDLRGGNCLITFLTKLLKTGFLKQSQILWLTRYCVGLIGTESKTDLLAKIKDTVIKKRSVFLYRKDLHQIVQNRSEAPERYAARIRQAAPPCCLQTDNKTSDYSADLI